MQELAARLERHFKFSGQELFRLSMSAIVAAFCLTIYQGWGWFNLVDDKSLASYFVNLAIAFCFVWLALWIHFAAQKIVSLKLGYSAEYTYWLNGFIISVILSFMTFGFIPIFFTGSVGMKIEPKLRMGRFREGIMHKDIGIISFAGPLASMIAAVVLSPFYILTENPVIYALIVANLLVSLYSLIPLPTFEGIRTLGGGTTGLYLFIASRWAFVFTAVLILVYALLILVAQVFSVILAFIIAILTAFFYYKASELK